MFPTLLPKCLSCPHLHGIKCTSYFTKSHRRVSVLLSCDTLDQFSLRKHSEAFIAGPWICLQAGLSAPDRHCWRSLGRVLLLSRCPSYFLPLACLTAPAVVPDCMLRATFHHCCLWHWRCWMVAVAGETQATCTGFHARPEPLGTFRSG